MYSIVLSFSIVSGKLTRRIYRNDELTNFNAETSRKKMHKVDYIFSIMKY